MWLLNAYPYIVLNRVRFSPCKFKASPFFWSLFARAHLFPASAVQRLAFGRLKIAAQLPGAAPRHPNRRASRGPFLLLDCFDKSMKRRSRKGSCMFLAPVGSRPSLHRFGFFRDSSELQSISLFQSLAFFRRTGILAFQF